jgi:D-xylose reductase
MRERGLKLNTGRTLPLVGLGTWKIGRPQTADVVLEAVRRGYRHLDCACDYGNEVEVGVGIQHAVRAGLCRREELWVTSKLWNTYHRREHVRPAVERSLRDLGLDHLDLYLIHFPIATKFVPFDDRYPPEWFFDPKAAEPRMELDRVPLGETWEAMEELVNAGLARDIGVCNFGCSLLRDLLSYARIRPAVLQVELHPFLTQEKLLRFCREQEIAVTAFSPLGALSYFTLGMARPEESVLETEVVRELARRYGRTPAQIVLRWGIQRGSAVVPKTTRPERLGENLAIFDFALTEAEMKTISGLNRDRRFNDPGDFCERAFNTFCPIYE